MDTKLLCYATGEKVDAGDRVQYKGTYARVVFVSDGEDEHFSAGYEDFIGSERGILLCDDDGATTALSDPDETLILIERDI